MAAKPKIIYFGLPGRAEVARLLLTVGNVDFEDKRMEREEWAAIKPTTPFGQVPCMDVGGTMIAQSAAIDRYCASVAGLLPQDPLTCALADQAYFFCEDVWKPLYASFAIQDADAKIKARQEALAGPIKENFAKLIKLVESAPGPFLTGDKITHGDLAVFCMLSTFQSGWLDGVPKNLLDDYPVLKAFRNKVASVPAIKAFYDKATDDIRVNGFRADA